MAIIKELTVYEAYDMIRYAQFMKNRHSLGFGMLFNYYEELSQEMNENVKFDPVSWYSTWYEFSGVDSRLELLKEIDEIDFESKGYDLASPGDIVEYLREYQEETVLFDRDPVNQNPIVLLKVR